jgi:transporter family-2 protein
MDGKAIAVMATAAAGGLVAMQAPINSGLGKTIGSLPAASFSFAVGLCALVGITLISGEGFGRLGDVGGLDWYWLIGGLLGAVYVTAATIAGQLTLSVVLDQLGILGLTQREITPARIVGVALLAAGVYLVVEH